MSSEPETLNTPEAAATPTPTEDARVSIDDFMKKEPVLESRVK